MKSRDEQIARRLHHFLTAPLIKKSSHCQEQPRHFGELESTESALLGRRHPRRRPHPWMSGSGRTTAEIRFGGQRTEAAVGRLPEHGLLANPRIQGRVAELDDGPHRLAALLRTWLMLADVRSIPIWRARRARPDGHTFRAHLPQFPRAESRHHANFLREEMLEGAAPVSLRLIPLCSACSVSPQGCASRSLPGLLRLFSRSRCACSRSFSAWRMSSSRRRGSGSRSASSRNSRPL